MQSAQLWSFTKMFVNRHGMSKSSNVVPHEYNTSSRIPCRSATSCTVSLCLQNSNRHLSHSSHCNSSPTFLTCCWLGENEVAFRFFCWRLGLCLLICRQMDHKPLQRICNDHQDLGLDLEGNEGKRPQRDPSSLVYTWYSLAVHTSSPGTNNVKLGSSGQ